MCGRYTLAGPTIADLQDLRHRFPLGESVELRRRWNVCPGDDVVCVTTDREGAPRGELLRWGLVPHFSKDPSSAYKMINARAETVAERPAYRDAFERRRCLVVADGFFEWQARPGKPKLPHWITRADGAPFAFAGLWATWRHPETDAALRTCAIVTTSANEVLTPLHDRMPVILDAGAEEAWLDPATPSAILHDLLAPLPSTAVGLRPVGPAVNDARHDGPDCLAPPPPEAELSLF